MDFNPVTGVLRRTGKFGHRHALQTKTQRPSGGRLYDNSGRVWSDAVVQAKEHQRWVAIENYEETSFQRKLDPTTPCSLTSSLQKYERMIFSCFNPPPLWYFVTAAPWKLPCCPSLGSVFL